MSNTPQKPRLSQSWTPGSVFTLLVIIAVLAVTVVPLSVFLIRLAIGG
jgi:hypothetical protein